MVGAFGLGGVVLVALFGILVARSAEWTARETAALQAIGDTRSAVCTGIALFIGWLFGPLPAVGLTLVAAGVVRAKTKSWPGAVALVIIVAVCWGSTSLMKLMVERPRPDPALGIGPPPMGFSYPSGHTAFACALVVALLFTLRDWRFRCSRLVAGAAVVILVAGSRVYLGVHYPSDVAAAVMLTVATAAIVIPLIVNGLVPRLLGPSAQPQ